MAGAQQVEEVEPALRTGGAEPGEAVVTDLRAEAILGLVPGTGVVDRDPAGAGQARAQHLLCFAEEAVLAVDQQTHHLSLRDLDADRAQERHQPRHPDECGAFALR